MRMEILFVASEVAPFSKSGGLGDVAGALPVALAARGHAVTVVSPRHAAIDPAANGLEPLHGAIRVHGEATTLVVKQDRGVRWCFVEHERFFGGRRDLYGEHGRDYPDNAERFAYLARAALALPAALRLRPRIVHANDWQTGLVPYLLRREHGADHALSAARSVFTIHNLAYQGTFQKGLLPGLGLPWEAFRPEAMEFHDHLSFMKAGLVFADALSAVSPTYAREILTREGGHQLDGVLRHRARDLTGILNGIDVHAWDPRTDPHLAARLDGDDPAPWKAASKAALQRELGLPTAPEVPLLAMVTRLVDQKGLDLLAGALPALLEHQLQLVVLGSGDPRHEAGLRAAAASRPARLAARIGFDEGLAHRIQAGADAFLMPSRFEPCGLTQMYALRYGTVPVVRAVGGLEDTVADYDGFRQGTGFKFHPYAPGPFLIAIRRALDVHRDRRAWAGLVARGMAEDNSWERSAARYEALYRTLAG